MRCQRALPPGSILRKAFGVLFYDEAAQKNGLRLQKLPRSEELRKEGLLCSLGSPMPVPSLQGCVGGRQEQQHMKLLFWPWKIYPKDPRETCMVGGAVGLESGKPSWDCRLREEVREAPLGHGFLICTHPCGLLHRRITVEHLTHAQDTRITLNGAVLVNLSPWRDICGVGLLRVGLRSRCALDPKGMARVYSRRAFLQNHLHLWASVFSSLKWKVKSS